jgi:16S rRNA (cytidine1402-2'-O)-methyltransferase
VQSEWIVFGEDDVWFTDDYPDVLLDHARRAGALVASGLPTRAFTFLGFLSKKTGARRKILSMLLAEGRTIVVYESPYRTGDLLADLAALAPDARVVIAREITKLHEEFVRGTAADLAARYASDRPKGEVTVVIAPADRDARGEDARESDA